MAANDLAAASKASDEPSYLFSDSDGDVQAPLANLHDLSAAAEELGMNGPNAPPPVNITFSTLERAIEYCQ
jgi:hypothetical protein